MFRIGMYQCFSIFDNTDIYTIVGHSCFRDIHPVNILENKVFFWWQGTLLLIEGENSKYKCLLKFTFQMWVL